MKIWLEREDLRTLARGQKAVKTDIGAHIVEDTARFQSFLKNPSYVKAAPILEEPGSFDAGFFGFSPMEAKSMDPQHRILLELAFEALENAGCDSERYSGRIGVFTGSAMNTYFMNSGLSDRFAEDYIPTLIVNDTGIYIQNGKGASITMIGKIVDINLGALTIT